MKQFETVSITLIFMNRYFFNKHKVAHLPQCSTLFPTCSGIPLIRAFISFLKTKFAALVNYVSRTTYLSSGQNKISEKIRRGFLHKSSFNYFPSNFATV